MRLSMIVGLVALAGSAQAIGAARSSTPPVLVIAGNLSTPRSVSQAEFKALPRTISAWTVHGKAMTCEGPWLIDVLAYAGVPTGDDVRGVALATIVVASGSDGYRAAFTLGELDHKLGNAPIIVADTCEGASLPASDGPLRIVATKDERGARSVRGLIRLTLVQAPASP